LILGSRICLATLALLGGCGSSSGALVPQRVRQEPGWLLAPGVRAFSQQGARDCGATALASVLNRWEPALPLEEIRRLVGPPDGEGVEAARLRTVALGRGLRAFLIIGSLADLGRELGAGRPVLVGVVRARWGQTVAHYQVITGVHTGRALVLAADPERGWTVVPLQAFLAEWDPALRLAFIVSP
jgi:ABC-type bacteriocin/lantibiotic exporter with double-glycine peptidase domain